MDADLNAEPLPNAVDSGPRSEEGPTLESVRVRMSEEIADLDASQSRGRSVGGWYAVTGNGGIVAEISEADMRIALDCVRAMAALESGKVVEVGFTESTHQGRRFHAFTGDDERDVIREDFTTPLAAILSASGAAPTTERSANDG